MRLPRPHNSARLTASVLAATLAAGACTSDDPTASDTDPTDLTNQDIVLTSGALATLNSCEDLLERLQAEGLERVGPYGFDGNYGFWGGDDVIFAEEAMDDATEASDSSVAEPRSATTGGTVSDGDASSTTNESGGESEFSGTNNQEGGVDEADFVKTDGKRLVVVTGNRVEILDVTGTEPLKLHTVELDGDIWAQDMFLEGDRAIVLAQTWEEPLSSASSGSGVDSIMMQGRNVSRFIEIDLETGTVGSDFSVEGNYLSGREVDGSIRIVLNSPIGQFPFVYASNEGAEGTAEKANRDVIENSTIEDWLPNYRAADGSVEQLFACDQMYIPQDFSGFGALSIITLDLTGGLDLGDSLGVLSEGQTIYSSSTRLAVTTTRWRGDFDFAAEESDDEDDTSSDSISSQDSGYTTSVHTFDISNPSNTSYVASGTIAGHLLNQYSMSEYEGHLRIATTEGAPWGDTEAQSGVVVLKENGSVLETVGSVSGLGKGEQIQSVRFMGDVGFIVTFRQTDPLYTVDLSDPTNPSVLGELKIPGFSAYLHPTSEGQLIGIGQDGTDEGQLLGAQVSVFDVSDLTNPTRVNSISFGENSNSAVGWDAKSFTWWGSTNIAFVPVSTWGWDPETDENQTTAQVVVLQIDEDGSITELGRISHEVTRTCYSDDGTTYSEDAVASSEAEELPDSDVDQGAEPQAPISTEPGPVEEWCYSYQPEISRSVIVDDTVFTVSDRGVQANALSGFAKTGWVEFDQNSYGD